MREWKPVQEKFRSDWDTKTSGKETLVLFHQRGGRGDFFTLLRGA